jgi:hypothetical protein
VAHRLVSVRHRTLRVLLLDVGEGFRLVPLRSTGAKLATGKPTGSFWQKRYYDRNVRDAQEFTVKLRYCTAIP